VAIRNHVKIEVHNFYKGLSITHDGVILKADKEHTLLTTNFLQLKAMQCEGKTILVSELFPEDILYNQITEVDFEKNHARVCSGELSLHNATHREFVYVEPELQNQTITIFKESRKLNDDVRLLNISVNSAKISCEYLFSGLKEKDSIHIDMVLNVNAKPFIIKTQALVSKIIVLKKGFELILEFVEDVSKLNRPLMDYVAQRQMFLIREFKKMQYSADGKIHKATAEY